MNIKLTEDQVLEIVKNYEASKPPESKVGKIFLIPTNKYKAIWLSDDIDKLLKDHKFKDHKFYDNSHENANHCLIYIDGPSAGTVCICSNEFPKPI